MAEFRNLVEPMATTKMAEHKNLAEPKMAEFKNLVEPMDLSTPNRQKRNRERGSPNEKIKVSKVRLILDEYAKKTVVSKDTDEENDESGENDENDDNEKNDDII